MKTANNVKAAFDFTSEMKEFTPAQWILIDAATQFGNDKDTFEDRLRFGRELLSEIKCGSDMSHWIENADNPALFTKAIIAIEDVLGGKPTGHVIGLDAAASGPQLLSIMTHCLTGMVNTGALNTGKVPDLYTTIYNNMENDGTKSRKQVKKATVPYVYGSEQSAANVFGDEAGLFEEAYEASVPMAALIRQVLINACDEDALNYQWDMPNGNHVYIEMRGLEEFKGRYGDYTYTYQTSVNRPLSRREKGGKSLVANVTHSCDAFVVEELDQRCNYNAHQVTRAIQWIEAHLAFGDDMISDGDHSSLELLHMQDCWERFNFTSVAALDYIRKDNLYSLNPEYLVALLKKAKWLLTYEPFETFTIHDEFKCSPNHVGRMQSVYNSIIAELYESTWLLDTIETLTGTRYEWDEPCDPEIYETLLNAEYAIG